MNFPADLSGREASPDARELFRRHHTPPPTVIHGSPRWSCARRTITPYRRDAGSMRDILLAAVIFGALPLVVQRPYIGILLWSWISYMNPHRLTWGFAYDFPFAALVAGAAMLGLLLSKEPKRIPWTPTTVALALFVLWMSLTTAFAFFPEEAMSHWEKVIKIQIMTFVMLMLMAERQRLHLLVWVIVASLAFYGIKGGIFAVLTGGEYRVWGPDGSFIEGNNELALTLIMALPLMRYLHVTTSNKYIRWALVASMALCTISVAASYSRGALLTLAVVGFVFWLKGRHKFVVGVAIAAAAAVVLALMPAQWYQRMDTIDQYEQDASAMGRIYAWQFAYNLAKDRPLVGGGFKAFDRSLHPIYAPSTDDPDAYIATDAHSVYFKVLGEHGFVGLALFLLLMALGFRTATWVLRHSKTRPELSWATALASMTQVSLVAYAVGGAFLGLTYFDLYYNLIAILILTRVCVARELQAASDTPAVSVAQPERPVVHRVRD